MEARPMSNTNTPKKPSILMWEKVVGRPSLLCLGNTNAAPGRRRSAGSSLTIFDSQSIHKGLKKHVLFQARYKSHDKAPRKL